MKVEVKFISNRDRELSLIVNRPTRVIGCQELAINDKLAIYE